MTDYVKNVNTESDEYEKKRKREAEEAVALINQAAKEKAAEEAAITDAAVAEEHRAALAAADTAAVQRQITVSQAKEKLAAMGLLDSGLANATAHAAGVYQTRQTNAANAKRDAAVLSLTEALARTEAELERDRAAAVQKENAKVTDDVASYRAGLLKSAYSAESRENVAKTQAESRENVAKTEAAATVEREKIKAQTEAATLAQKQAQKAKEEKEEQRLLAIKQLYTSKTIPTELYSQAIEKGWDVDTTLTKLEEWVAYRRVSAEAQQRYHDEGFDSMMNYLAPQNLNDDQLDALCHTLDLSRKRVDEWLAGWRVFMDSAPSSEWLGYYERKGANEYTAL